MARKARSKQEAEATTTPQSQMAMVAKHWQRQAEQAAEDKKTAAMRDWSVLKVTDRRFVILVRESWGGSTLSGKVQHWRIGTPKLEYAQLQEELKKLHADTTYVHRLGRFLVPPGRQFEDARPE